jgi:hypothetical protein
LKAALIAGALALATVAAPTAALANTPPPTKVYASDQGWINASVKPSELVTGGPFFTGLHWQYWGTRSAQATGTLWVMNTGCAPTYRCHFHSFPVLVLLTEVKQHGSVHYFGKMTVMFYRNGAWHTQVAVFKTFCSTCTYPGWAGPSAWPYL